MSLLAAGQLRGRHRPERGESIWTYRDLASCEGSGDDKGCTDENSNELDRRALLLRLRKKPEA